MKEGYFQNNIFYGENSPRASEKSFNFSRASPNEPTRHSRASMASNMSQNSLLSKVNNIPIKKRFNNDSNGDPLGSPF